MTALIEEIRQKISDEQFEFSKHAVDQSIVRKILLREIREAILNGKIIEDYPDDKYGASCLISGLTQDERPIQREFGLRIRAKPYRKRNTDFGRA